MGHPCGLLSIAVLPSKGGSGISLGHWCLQIFKSLTHGGGEVGLYLQVCGAFCPAVLERAATLTCANIPGVPGVNMCQGFKVTGTGFVKDNSLCPANSARQSGPAAESFAKMGGLVCRGSALCAQSRPTCSH